MRDRRRSHREILSFVLALAAPLCLALAAPVAAQSQASAAAPAAAPVNLRPIFRKGQLARYQVWTLRDQTTTLTGGGQQQSVSVRMEFNGEVTWRVERVGSDGSATCTMTLDWISATLTAPDGSVQHNDTRQGSGDTPPVHALLRAMAGVPVRVEMAADGTPTRVSGIDPIRRHGEGTGLRVPDETDFMETAADLAALPEAPTEAALGQAWETVFTWNHEVGRMRHATRHTLGSLEEIAGIPVAMVTGTTRLALEPDRERLPPLPPGADVDIRLLEGKADSQVMFDLQRGEAVGRNTLQRTRIETRLRFQGQTMTQTTAETLQSQALRIAEE